MSGHFQEKLHNQENLVFNWVMWPKCLYVAFGKQDRSVWWVLKEKKKRSKVLTQCPCLPPQKWPIFLTLLRNFPKTTDAVTVNPLGNDFQPPPPPQQKILSIVGGNGSGYFNGIDHHLFMVRGLIYSSSKLKENRQQLQQQQQWLELFAFWSNVIS